MLHNEQKTLDRVVDQSWRAADKNVESTNSWQTTLAYENLIKEGASRRAAASNNKLNSYMTQQEIRKTFDDTYRVDARLAAQKKVKKSGLLSRLKEKASSYFGREMKLSSTETLSNSNDSLGGNDGSGGDGSDGGNDDDGLRAVRLKSTLEYAVPRESSRAGLVTLIAATGIATVLGAAVVGDNYRRSGAILAEPLVEIPEPELVAPPKARKSDVVVKYRAVEPEIINLEKDVISYSGATLVRDDPHLNYSVGWNFNPGKGQPQNRGINYIESVKKDGGKLEVKVSLKQGEDVDIAVLWKGEKGYEMRRQNTNSGDVSFEGVPVGRPYEVLVGTNIRVEENNVMSDGVYQSHRENEVKLAETPVKKKSLFSRLMGR
jgi:hypothetical protein